MDSWVATPLPRLQAALIARYYPRVCLDICEHRRYINWRESEGEGLHVAFSASTKEILISLGLAELSPTRGEAYRLRVPAEYRQYDGLDGYGGWGGDLRGWYIHWHNCNGDVRMPGKRAFPPRKTEAEVQRIWKRISRLGAEVRP